MRLNASIRPHIAKGSKYGGGIDVSCVDQLTSILIRWVDRAPPGSHYHDPPHVLRRVVPWVGLDGLLDPAFEQIRHYAVADAGVSLRLMRAFGDIASTTSDPDIHALLVRRGRQLISGCEGKLQQDDIERLRQRFSHLQG